MTEIPHPSPESVFSLCYTGGTTGYPKGGIITHRNILVLQNGLQKLGI